MYHGIAATFTADNQLLGFSEVVSFDQNDNSSGVGSKKSRVTKERPQKSIVSILSQAIAHMSETIAHTRQGRPSLN